MVNGCFAKKERETERKQTECMIVATVTALKGKAMMFYELSTHNIS